MRIRSKRGPATPREPIPDLYDRLTVSLDVAPHRPERVARRWVVLLWLGPAAGILSLALGDAAGRMSSPWADTLYWLGLCLIYLPSVARLFLGGQISRSEGLSATLTVAFGFSLVRILAYPTGYALFDEFQHWRSLQDILASGHLFSQNPILPVSPAFPGLELVTDSLIKLSGLPPFVASMCVIALAKQLLTLALFLTFERVARSTRFATLATLIYLANPTVLYDDGQFAYELVGLALAALSLYFLICATTQHGAERTPYLALALPAMAALIVTHHVSGILFVGFVIFWAVIEPRFDNGLGSWRVPVIAIMMVAPMMILWYVKVAQVVWWYLAPFPQQALVGLFNLLSGTGKSHVFFSSDSLPVPVWEQLASYGTVIIVAGGLVFGWFVAVARYRLSGLGRVFALAAMAYFGSLALHFVPAGLEGATRLMGWSFIPAGFLLALDALVLTRAEHATAHATAAPVAAQAAPVGQAAPAPPARGARRRGSGRLSRLAVWRVGGGAVIPVALTLACVVMLLGNISIDAGFTWFHTPGPYLPGADARSITPESTASAIWMRQTLGQNNRLATDTEDSLLFATYGRQFPVTNLSGSYDPSVLFTESQYDAQVRQIIADQRLRYLVVDVRMSEYLPANGSYFGGGKTQTAPLSLSALEKFSSVVGIDLVYDSGNILIYAVR